MKDGWVYKMLQIAYLPSKQIAGFGVDRSLGQWRGVLFKKSGGVKLSQQTEADLYSDSIDLMLFIAFISLHQYVFI